MRTMMSSGLALAITLSASAGQDLQALPNGDNYVANRVIVALEYGAPKLTVDRTIHGIAESGVQSIDDLCKEMGVSRIEPFYRGRLTKPALVREASRMYIFTLADGLDAAELGDEFSSCPEIDYASLYMSPKLHYIPNDPRTVDQWYLAYTQAYEGWDIVRGDTTKYSIIGIVDSGVHWGHSDLTANIWINAAEDANHNGRFDNGDNDGIDADSNGFIDDVVGWDFGNDDNQPSDDASPHGTAVAGCASEVTDNNLRGAAIGFSARLMCVKVFSDQGGIPNAYQGILYAAENGAQIINCSWGTLSFNQAEQNLINAAWQTGALIIASAGAQQDTTRNYPAAYNHVMAVAATDANDHKAVFSGYGTWVDICAPGTNIWTTYGESDFVEYSGTSFSTALVSGLAALVRAWYPYLTNDEVEQLIESSADTIYHLNPGYRGLLGAGRINCHNWISTGVNEEPVIPSRLVLWQNYPNPFNATTSIRYALPRESEVTFDIFNIVGQKVVSLGIGVQPAGVHTLNWDGDRLSSGIYFYRISAAGLSEMRRCILQK